MKRHRTPTSKERTANRMDEVRTPRHSFSMWLKILALMLSILMVFYAVPTTVYAELIEAIDTALQDTEEDSATTEEAADKGAIFEVVDRREESVKHFRLADGSYTAVQYTVPVHEKDENGVWQDIDNTLLSSGREYSTSNAKVKFAKQIPGNENLFTLHDGHRKITMSLRGATKKVTGQVTNTQTEFPEDATKLQKMMTLDKLSPKILYAEILEGVDLEYVVNAGNIKENIIVKERGEAYNYTFEIKVNNLEAVLCEDGSVSLLDPDTAEVVYIIPKGYMMDADGAYSDAVAYTLTGGSNGKYTLTVSADVAWMNEEGRAFPVTIDPPINTTPAKEDTVDTYLDSANPNAPYRNFSYLAVGTGSNDQEFISYWRATTLPSLPANAYIVSAEFSMYCQQVRPHSSAPAYLELGVYRVTSEWTSELTWAGHTNTSAGSFTDDTLIDYATLDLQSADQYISWDITPLYKNWQANGASYNRGIAIAQINTQKTDALFDSTENTHAPRLMVEYRDMKGIESYWPGSSHSAGLAGSGFVNYATGNLVFSVGMTNTGDALFDFTPALVYNTAIANVYNTNTYNPNVHYKYISWGYGLKLNTNESIVERTYTDEDGETKTFYIWADGDGTEHYFMYNEDTQEWKDEDGLGLTLEINASEYAIKDQSHQTRHFTNSSGSDYIYAGGVLKNIEDQYGNKLRFNYNAKGQTTTIDILPSGHSTENAIQCMTFSYNTLGILYRVENVVTGQVMTLEYGTSFTDNSWISTTNGGPLRKVTYGHMEETTLVTDAVMSYTYTNEALDGIYRLASAKDESSGTEIRYAYDTAGRVKEIAEYATGNTLGQSMRLSYGTGQTTVRNSGKDDVLQLESDMTGDDILTRYTLDGQGRAVSVYSVDVSGKTIYGASNGVYNDEENDAAKNSLKSSGVMNGVTPNYIQNGSFAHGVEGWTGDISASNIVNGYQNNDSTYRHNCLCLSVDANAQEKTISQYVRIPNGTYTMSAWVAGTGDNPNMTVTLKAVSDAHTYETTYTLWANQGSLTEHSPTLTITAEDDNNEYEDYRIIITVKDPSASGGTVFVDDVMLGNNIGVGTYNMLQYGAFDETTVNHNGVVQAKVQNAWVAEPEANITYGASGGMGSSKCVKIAGALDDIYAAVSQTIPMGITREPPVYPHARTFTVSGFAKGTHQIANINAIFGLDVEVLYTDDSTDLFCYDFNKEMTGWQFVSGTFTTDPDKTIASITVNCAYVNNPGIASFDNISLIEETSQNAAGYQYTEDGLLELMYTPALSEYYEYDENNNLTTVYNSQGNGIAYVYNDGNTLLSQTSFRYNPSQNDLLLWYFAFRTDDAKWNIANVTYAMSKTEYTINRYGLNTKTISYAAEGTKDTAIQASGSQRLLSTTSYYMSAGSILFGKVNKTTDTAGNATLHHYDAKGRLTYQVNDDQTGLYYEYDVLGRTTNIYPLAYLQVSGVYYYYANSLAEKATYTYNADHSLHTITTATTVYAFEYDEFGNTTAIKLGEGDTATTLVSYAYAPHNGKLMSMTYGNGKAMTYTYDELDRVSEICYTDDNGTNQYYRYVYTAHGQIHSVESTQAGRMYRYDYNSKGQTVGAVELTRTGYDSEGKPIYVDALQSSYWYDEKDRVDYVLHSIAYEATSTGRHHGFVSYEYVYDDADQETQGNAETKGTLTSFIIQQADDDIVTYTYGYDDLNRPISKEMTDTDSGFYQGFEYEYLSQNSAYTTGQIGTAYVYTGHQNADDKIETAYTYEYDVHGNITKITDSAGNITRYFYDDMGQLTREDNPYLNKTYSYTYDNAGNRTGRKTYAYTTGTLATATATATQTLTYNTGAWGDQLANTTYDAVGNPLTYNGFDMTWSGRQLTQMSRNGGQNKYTFTYNDEGIRTSKNSNGTMHYYTLNGSQIVSESWGIHLLVYLYDELGAPIGLQYRNTSYAKGVFDTYYFEKNTFGDITGIFTQDGTKIGSYKYDAWGNCTRTAVSGITQLQRNIVNGYNPFRYRGYFYDVETALYYLQSRYYDPSTGRFVNADGYVNANGDLLGYNMYAYCGNNPIMNVDPTGHAWYHWALGAAIVAACAVATVVTCGGFAAAATAVTLVASGTAAGTAAATVATSALIGSATVYASAVAIATSNSSSVEEFCEQGNWGTVAGTAIGMVGGGYSGYQMAQDQIPTTTTTANPSPKINYPGNDPSRCDVSGFEWRGSGSPASGHGNYVNMQTGEWLHPDLNHGPPIGPHWDYGVRGSSQTFRIFPDGSISSKN